MRILAAIHPPEASRKIQIAEAKANIEALGPALDAAQDRLAHDVKLALVLEDFSVPTGPANGARRPDKAVSVMPASSRSALNSARKSIRSTMSIAPRLWDGPARSGPVERTDS